VRTCWSSTPRNASIAASANRNAPADAIRPDTEPGTDAWVDFNRQFSEAWANITRAKEPLPDASAHDGEPNKLEKYFSEKPGDGD
jgi:ferredoxin